MSRASWLCVLLGCTTSEPPPRPLGTFTPRLEADPVAQARSALARDAQRREHRFREAVDPGHRFAATRLGPTELETWPASDLFEVGAELFDLTWTRELGFGGRDRPDLTRFHDGLRGGPDATRCAACHWRGGPAGAGDAADNAYLDGDGDHQASTLARNPRPLHGLGLVATLAQEMSAELVARRQALAEAARRSGEPARGALHARSVAFGFLTVMPDGSVDASEVRGVDSDLVVRPFGWKGHRASLRDVVEDALVVHHGIEAPTLVREGDIARVGPYGGDDPDGDGVVEEVTDAQVVALVLYVAMQEVPVEEAPADARALEAYRVGEARFSNVGCAECHRPTMRLEQPRFSVEHVGGTVEVDLAREGAEPRAVCDSGCSLALFSDLRRHDMGPGLADSRPERGVPASHFLTPPLWGIARSRPYLHDGRASTLHDAIRLHGGDAADSRDAYLALPHHEQGAIRAYLTSLTRARRLVVR
ncbi:MAG: di-heme oxidoredictase family protein [Myxococcota bacterium]